MLLDTTLSFIVILIGVYGLTTSKFVIKSIILLNVTQTAIILLFLNFSNQQNFQPPLLPGNIQLMVDPLPQALMLTTIVIGAAITALALMLSIKIFHYYGTLNWKELLEREC
ncbi:sodium:proton antiporter [Oceanirhabdus seepicola]|uniref:Cation:proton antiporter subunit C n=1 Tax=Oceanirhabdus seepicola TaxID=2828781 RepID=A0A9J6P4Y9_9CLOT|nr:cation:proton antiporter subunit C [Oceanirhabdus seepicola]MCM1991292.1 cation:proton antiporter subunit C [Oceanirhabdus seepicola]